MKNQLLLVGMFAICATSLQASGYPQGDQSSRVAAKASATKAKTGAPAAQEEMDAQLAVKHFIAVDQEEVATSVSVNYVAGYYSPSNMVVGQNGVYAVTATTNPTRQFLFATADWSNGVEASVIYNTGTSYSYRAYYRFLTNNSNRVTPFTEPSTYADAASTLSLGGTATGVAGNVTAVSGSYKLQSSNDVIVESQHLVANLNGFVVTGSGGATVGYLDHSSFINYTQLTDGSVSKNTAHEQTVHGGPTTSITIVKYVGAGFSFYATGRWSGHAAAIKHLATEQNILGTTNNGYNVNTQSTINKLYVETEAGIGLDWTHEQETGTLWTFHTGWKGGVTANSNMLFSSSSGTQALKDQNLNYGLLSAGLAVTW